MIITSYEDIKIYIFHKLVVNLCQKEDDDSHTNNS